MKRSVVCKRVLVSHACLAEPCAWSVRSVLSSYISSINLFLTLSLSVFALSLLCVCVLQGLHASSWWDLCVCEWNWCPCQASDPGRDTGQTVLGIQGIHEHDCEPRDCCVCAFTSELSLRARDEERDMAVCAYVLSESCWRQLVTGQTVWPVMSVSCLYLCVSVCHQETGLALLTVEPAKGKAAATSPSLGRDPGCLGSWLGLSNWTRAIIGQSGWRRWLGSFASCNTYQFRSQHFWRLHKTCS